jgi:hypothetical protein
MLFSQGPVLQRAAAARPKVLANGFGAFVARLIDMDEVPTVRMACDRRNCNGFARQGVGYINRAFRRVGNAVTAMAEPRNSELLRHAPPQPGIRYCRRLLRSAKA